METSNQFDLFRERRFRPFFFTQFLGAFNDNVYKNAIIIMITFQLTTSLDINTLVNLAAGLFILPFFLFSTTAGQLADKYDKSRLMRHVKSWEIVIMIIGAVALHLGEITLLLVVLFLMGTQSTFFGPAKYGILPQHLKEQELVGGNGLVESGTFVAILVGTLFGGFLVNLGEIGRYVVGLAVILFAILGRWASAGIPTAPAVDPQLKITWNFFTETLRVMRYVTENRTVFLSILGISWFWFYGAVYLAQFPNYTRLVLGGDGTVATVLLTVFSLGIGIGSLLCERLSRRRIELGVVPLGAIGLTVFGIDLAFAHGPAVEAGPCEAMTLDGECLVGAWQFISDTQNWRVLIDLTLISLSGGLYIVPLYAVVQHRSEQRHRSRIIAGNNILGALAMVIAALMSIVLLNAGLSIPGLFLTVAIMTAAVAVFIFSLVPEFLMRLLIWALVHSIYRIQKEDLHHIPEAGAAILVSNHVSFVDPLIIAAVSPRPVRFVTDHGIFNTPILNFIFRTAKAIPTAPAKEDPELQQRAHDQIATALDKGELVCIFPEGKITEDGQINPFKTGIERIVERTPVPVIPIALKGMWGTFFSRKAGAPRSTRPRRLWSKVAIVSGSAVSADVVRSTDLREIVADLRGDWR